MGGNLLSFIDLLGFYCDLDGFYVAVIRTLEVTSKGEYAIGTQHLEQEVRVMWNGHELGQSRSIKDSIV